MQRKHYDGDHLAFGDLVRTFISREILPSYLEWESAGISPRELFTSAGSAGLLALEVPEEYGGAGLSDFRFNQLLGEELMLHGIAGAGIGLTLHNDVCLPYFTKYCTDEQRHRWLPGITSGELITAVAMSEPGAGSDLAGIRTSAVAAGSDLVVNGAKTFITNGVNADLVITVVRTSPIDTRASLWSSSNEGCPASSADGTSTRSACILRTPPSSPLPTFAYRKRMSSARSAPASAV